MNGKEELERRIKGLSGIGFSIDTILLDALNDLDTKPKTSVIKCGFVLQTIVACLIDREQPGKNTDIRRFINQLDNTMNCPDLAQRIRPRIRYVWSMVNILKSSENVEPGDAYSVLDNTTLICEWFNLNGKDSKKPDDEKELEIFPIIKAKYAEYLRSEIISVKFRQTATECFLQIVSEYNLGFIATGEHYLPGCPEPKFNPSTNIYENAQIFLNDFSERDIIECLPLFEVRAERIIAETIP